MSKLLLASFCNIPTPTSSPILAISTPLKKNSKIIPINIGSSKPISTATGMASGNGKVFIAFISEGYWVSVLDEKTLLPVFQYKFPTSQDIHSMLVDGKYLYVISTGTDELIRYEITNKDIRNPKTIWKASDDKKENHHINSIFKFRGDLILSAFGKSRMDNAWRTATDGIIFNVTKGIILKDKIYQPHTVTSNGEELFYCESGKGLFSSMIGAIKSLDGYARGVQFESKNIAYVATSVGRSKNKKSSLIYNPADYGHKNGKCGIHTINISSKKSFYIDFGWFANEIYDLLLVNSKVNEQKLFMNSFLKEREYLSSSISENNGFWNYVKGKVK